MQSSRQARPTEEAMKDYRLHRSLGKRLWLLLGMFSWAKRTLERPLLAAVEKGDCRMGRVTSICEPKTSGNMAHTVAVPIVGWHTA